MPHVKDIRPGERPHTYVVTLLEDGGEPRPAVFTVWQGEVGGASTDWDISWRWSGDAESLRSVVSQVTLFDRRRDAQASG